MVSSRLLTAITLLLAGAASCGGNGGPGGDARVDSGDPTEDGSAPTDSGMTTDWAPWCAPRGRHRCGTGCVADLDNLPTNGCRLGCGESCPASPDGPASCTEAGQCAAPCVPPFRMEGGVCVCVPETCEDAGAMCGSPDDGCGMSLSCGTCPGGAPCTDGVCVCPAGPEEPNEARFMAPTIAAMTDAPDSNEVFSTYNIHSIADEDWFKISVADDFDAGNPQITVTLRGIPAGDDYDLAAYYVCDAGGDSSSCTTGTVDNMIGRGCASTTTGDESVEISTECSGTDEAGALLIHVTATTFAATCGNYELEVDVR